MLTPSRNKLVTIYKLEIKLDLIPKTAGNGTSWNAALNLLRLLWLVVDSKVLLSVENQFATVNGSNRNSIFQLMSFNICSWLDKLWPVDNIYETVHSIKHFELIFHLHSMEIVSDQNVNKIIYDVVRTMWCCGERSGPLHAECVNDDQQ